jgi:hypothetical protein
MTDDGKPLALTILLLGLSVLVLFLFQPYTAWPGAAFGRPAVRYVRAALHGDSVKVARLSASAEPVAWALSAARSHRESLAFWSGSNDARTGVRSGDTTQVFLYPSGSECSEAPIILRLVGSGGSAKVVSAASACIAAAGP